MADVTKKLLNQVLRTMIEGLIPSTDGLVLHERYLDGLYHFSIELPKPHRGYIIGRHGHIFKAIQTILSSIAKRHGERVFIELME